MQYSAIDRQQTRSSTTESNIKVAHELIQELATRGVDTTMLEVAALIATGQKESLDLAEQQLKQLISKNKGYVPGLVQIALI
jgi:DNA-directed RNA polymerase specialized sigma54-like protein